MSRQPVFTENNTYLYTHFSLDVSAIINPEAGAYGLDEDDKVVPLPGSSATLTDTTIRHYLLQPRRQLVFMMVDGDILLLSPQKKPGNGSGYYSTDCNNGPLPKNFTITRIDGDHLFRVNFSIETWINECEYGNSAAVKALLANVFSQQHSVDDSFMTQITTTGQAFFRSDVLENANEVADSYRDQCLPPTPRGFKRTSYNVAVTASRNVLTYNCVDQQMFYDIGDTNPLLGGSGISRIEAVYNTGTIANEGGVAGGRSFAEMSVKIWGVKEASLWHLTQKAFEVAGAKLPLDKMPFGGVLSNISLTQNMTAKDVALRIQVTLPPPAVGKLGVLNTDVLRIDTLFDTDVLGKNPAPYNDNGSRGSYNKEILTSKLKAACVSVAQQSESRYASSGAGTNYDNSPPVDPVIVYTDVVPSYNPKISYQERRAFHTDYRMDFRYIRQFHRSQIPVAKDPYQQSGNSPGSNTGSAFRGGQNPSTDPNNQPAIVPDCEIVSLAYPTTKLVITWTAERVGEPPRYPNPFGVEENFVLLEDRMQAASKELAPDGQNFIHRLTGEYTFGLRSARGPGDNLPTGILPLWDDTYESGYIESKYAVPGIIGPTPGQ